VNTALVAQTDPAAARAAQAAAAAADDPVEAAEVEAAFPLPRFPPSRRPILQKGP